jgi:hypothetical protein
MRLVVASPAQGNVDEDCAGDRIMEPANFDIMNETDVREVVVRPLLERLGYRHGTAATIREMGPAVVTRRVFSEE